VSATVLDQLRVTLGAAYVIERELGGGGMSRVFVAEETALGRKVVVKVIAPELMEGVSAERFAREVRLAARLQQANIVPVLAAGSASGLPYYTMPFVGGQSLRARLARGERVSIADALHILRDVALALAYAHGEGVVHRDIKPENILLSGGTAVVTDFGIARALSASRTTEGSPWSSGSTLTQAGLAIGTPAYMAPEQAAGEANVDHRADLYAWGIVAWELLAGTHPFAQHTTVQALVAAHLRDMPSPVSAARPDVPRALSDLVARCLAKDRSARPASANELLAGLDHASTPHGQAPYRGVPSLAQHRWWPVAVAAALAVVALGTWVATRRGAVNTSVVPARASLVVLPFESATGDTANAYFGEGMADEVATALAKVPGLQLASRNSANVLRGKRATVQEIGRSLGVSAVLHGSVRRSGSRMRVLAELTNASTGIVMWSDIYERELRDVFAVQDDIAREIVGALRVTLGGATTRAPSAGRGTDNLEAYDDYLRGLYFFQRRGAFVPKAVEAFTAAIAKDSTFARAYAGLGMALTAMTIYTNTPSPEVLPRALRAAERAAALDSTSAEAFVAQGIAQVYRFDWAEAEAAYSRSITLDSTLALAHLWYGRHLWVVGRNAEALEQLQRANSLDPLSAVNPASLSLGLTAAGRYDEAVTTARRAFDMDSTLLVAQSAYLFALVSADRAAEARVLAEQLLRSSSEIGTRGAAAYAVGRAGDTVRTRELIKEFRQRQQEWRSSTALIRAYSGVRDTTGMLDVMERAVDIKDPFVMSTPLADKLFDPVRGSARFAAIVERLGLDPARYTAEAVGRSR
jgi:eukaryotic-like serine/threonine-protein kinase